MSGILKTGRAALRGGYFPPAKWLGPDQEEIKRLQGICSKQAKTIAAMRELLQECLGDYGHPRFTDRHGMADRIRAVLKEAK